MRVFTASSTRRSVTPWGVEVKKRLIDRSMKQEDLVAALKGRGFQIDKQGLSNLLYGVGVSNRQGEIELISALLEIPYQSQSADGKQGKEEALWADC